MFKVTSGTVTDLAQLERDRFYRDMVALVQELSPEQAELIGADAEIKAAVSASMDRAIVPDKAAIANFVDQVYPVSTSGGLDWRAIDYKEVPPQTEWYNDAKQARAWKPAQIGDSVPGPQQVVNKQLIPAGDFKCP